MKEFDVKFFIKDDDGDDYDFTEWYLNSQNVLELFTELEAFPCRIYVKSESEHIFEPKEGDFGIVKNFNPLIFVRFRSNYNSWGYEGDEYYEQFNNDEVNIIYRNGKHFFNPKEEN
jgi:hypothetical protein